ncbi:MAG: 50S ribosomal protein L11 methyltransferase [Prevotellaceae bacterium]|nr:50S ribosomal protein L11 methyltransferase [Prevotellaceae bacterium]
MKYLVFTFLPVPCTETVTDVLAGVLGEIGFESFVPADEQLEAYIRQSQYDASALQQALADFPLRAVRITFTCRECEDRDWNEEWEKRFFQPIVIEGECVVHSTFHREVPQARYDIAINPQMAFGTGHHQTTYLMMQELLHADLAGKCVLDMGCGTSILAILARMRGAARCLAIDIDDWCVRNSLENISLNRVGQIDVRQGDASALTALDETFDIVLANINRNILLADMRHYARVMEPAGTLFMSGFYREDIPMILAEAERCGLTPLHTGSKDNWAVVAVGKGACTTGNTPR